MSPCSTAGRRDLRNPACGSTATRRGAPKRYYTSVVQNVKCIKAIRVWPGDGRFFTSRTRSRFPLMLRLPAPGGSHFSTVLCFTRLPSPSEPPCLPAQTSPSCLLPYYGIGPFSSILGDIFSISAILPILKSGSIRKLMELDSSDCIRVFFNFVHNCDIYEIKFKL